MLVITYNLLLLLVSAMYLLYLTFK